MKSNPVLIEWLSSPIRYRWNEPVASELLAFAGKTTFGITCAHQGIVNLALQQWDKHVGKGEEVNYKKYFYVLRPALVLHWLQRRHDVPPMNLQSLVAGLDLLAPELVAEIEGLLERKAEAKEIGTGPRVAPIDFLLIADIRELDSIGTFGF